MPSRQAVASAILVVLVLQVPLSSPAPTCATAAQRATLCHLSPANLTAIAADDADACCAACSVVPTCRAWCFSGALWTPTTPCHLSPLLPLNISSTSSEGVGCGYTASAKYEVKTNASRQTIWGIGFEIQSDSIGSGNAGMPKDGNFVPDSDNSTSSVPHELEPSERNRLAKEMLSGFRWCRLALGLYLRGWDASQKHIVGRWPSQMIELQQLQQAAGFEGFAAEYWSPPPGWKSTRSYYNGSLASLDPVFLRNFSLALVQDLKYFDANGLNVTWWGLQNEPTFDAQNLTAADCAAAGSSEPAAAQISGQSYSVCYYSQCDYYKAFKVVGPVIKEAFPNLKIHANSAMGQLGASPIASDDALWPLIDAWTWHFVGQDRSVPITKQEELTRGTRGRPVINNEFEYQPDQAIAGTPQSTLNTAQLMMNFFVFANSPAFYWIHALKPTTNVESKGYGLGWWRPFSDTNTTHFPTLEAGHWTYNPVNYHAVAGFAKLIPWDSVRISVDEESVLEDARILVFRTPETTLSAGSGGPLHAFKTPPNRLGVVLAYGRDASVPFTYQIRFDDGLAHTLNGYRFTPDDSGYNVPIGSIEVPAGGSWNATLQPLSIEFWLEW